MTCAQEGVQVAGAQARAERDITSGQATQSPSEGGSATHRYRGGTVARVTQERRRPDVLRL
jgi:hypothetical protein